MSNANVTVHLLCCSEEQLFSTQQSYSPLSLLIKNFGAETCEDLLELNTTDGMFRLSGYVSGPQNIASPKVDDFSLCSFYAFFASF